jgi:hypothetical protein
MRGKKAKMLRSAAATEAEQNGQSERRLYQQYKGYYTRLALQKSQQPQSAPKAKPKSPSSLGTTAVPNGISIAAPIVAHPIRLIRERLRDEHTTIGNLTGGRVTHIKQAGRLLAKHQLDAIALGGRLV